MTKRSVRRQSFTLVEIIAVLLVIAILAAVAAPKFIGMATTAREGVARAGINEAKASLSVAYAKAYLEEGGGAINSNQVMAAASFSPAPAQTTFGDIIVTLTETDDDTITINAVSVSAETVTGVFDTFEVPSNP